MAYIVPKYIADKVRKLQKVIAEGNRLEDELSEYFSDLMDGTYMTGFSYVDEPRGSEQNDGEYVDQHRGYAEDDFYGTYYYPTKDGGYICISYET